MICFTHHDKSAVGICKKCGRALCPDCIVVNGNTILCNACTETHENHTDEVLGFLSILQKKFAFIFSVIALVFLLSGMILVIAGFTLGGILGLYIISPLGIVFIIGSMLQYSAAKKFIES